MGGRLVCEFAYIRQEKTESDELNRFPVGQTHVGFTKYTETLRNFLLLCSLCSHVLHCVHHLGGSSSSGLEPFK